MELSELKGYLETEKSKKIIKLLSKIMKSEGKNELYQTITIYEGGDVSYYFSPYTERGSIEIPPAISNYLDNLYEEISNMNIESDEDNVNYSTIDVTFDFEDDVFRILLTDYVYDTQGFSTESELDNNDEIEKEIIETLNQWLSEGYKFVKVDYSGGGDSGYIESNGYTDDGDVNIQIPAGLEDYIYQMLESNYGGWEINEGSQGTFLIDTVQKTITLEHLMNEEKGINSVLLKVNLNY